MRLTIVSEKTDQTVISCQALDQLLSFPKELKAAGCWRAIGQLVVTVERHWSLLDSHGTFSTSFWPRWQGQDPASAATCSPNGAARLSSSLSRKVGGMFDSVASLLTCSTRSWVQRLESCRIFSVSNVLPIHSIDSRTGSCVESNPATTGR
jgi:hypothetical protein